MAFPALRSPRHRATTIGPVEGKYLPTRARVLEQEGSCWPKLRNESRSASLRRQSGFKFRYLIPVPTSQVGDRRSHTAKGRDSRGVTRALISGTGFLDDAAGHPVTAGDMPNLHIPASGDLQQEVLNPNLSLAGMLDADGAAVILHA